jgi:hypothetical protein
MSLARLLLVLGLLGASASAGAAEPRAEGAGVPLSAPTEGAAAPAAVPAASLDWSSAGAYASTSAPPVQQPRHHTLLWLWGALGALLITSIAVTVQQRTTPQPVYGNSGQGRVFP